MLEVALEFEKVCNLGNGKIWKLDSHVTDETFHYVLKYSDSQKVCKVYQIRPMFSDYSPPFNNFGGIVVNQNVDANILILPAVFYESISCF